MLQVFPKGNFLQTTISSLQKASAQIRENSWIRKSAMEYFTPYEGVAPQRVIAEMVSFESSTVGYTYGSEPRLIKMISLKIYPFSKWSPWLVLLFLVVSKVYRLEDLSSKRPQERSRTLGRDSKTCRPHLKQSKTVLQRLPQGKKFSLVRLEVNDEEKC